MQYRPARGNQAGDVFKRVLARCVAPLQDTRGSLPTHSAYITAANSAEQHADKVLGVITNLGDQAHAARHRQAANGTRAGSGRLQPTLPKSAAQRPEGPPSTESVVRMWEAVDAAAHCAVSMLGKARGNLLSLQSHMDASTKWVLHPQIHTHTHTHTH